MSSMMFFSKSWVMGRENLIFSNSLAMAVASSKPIQMGTALSDATSLRIMMGLLVKGSMVSPVTVISINMLTPLELPGAAAIGLQRVVFGPLALQRMGMSRADGDAREAAHQF